VWACGDRMMGEELRNAWKDKLKSLILEENVKVQKLFWILDEHCSGKGDQSIAGG